MEYVSASKLISDGLCPFRAKNEKFTKNEATMFGSSVDAGITAVLNGMRQYEEVDFNENFAKAAAEEKLDVTPAIIERANKAYNTFRDAADGWLNIDGMSIVCVQSDDGEAEYHNKKFFEVPVGKDWGLRGAFDFVDFYRNEKEQNVLRIVDWKTGNSEADDLQLKLYALAGWIKYSKGFDIDVIETRFFYLEQGGKSPAQLWNKESLVTVLAFVEEKAKTFLNRKEYPKTPNKYCGYCQFKDTCEACKALVAAPPKLPEVETTKENLPTIINEIDRLEIIKNLVDKALNSLKYARNKLLLDAKDEGVKIGDNVYYAKEIPNRYTYDLAPIFVQTQELINRPPYEIFEFSNKEFDALVSSIPDKVIKKALKQLKMDHRQLKSTSVRVTSKPAEAIKAIENNSTEEGD